MGLRVSVTGVTVTLGCTPHASELTLLQWHTQAAQVVDHRKRRRDAVEAAAAAIPEWQWADFLERCNKAARWRAEPSSSGTQQRPPPHQLCGTARRMRRASGSGAATPVMWHGKSSSGHGSRRAWLRHMPSACSGLSSCGRRCSPAMLHPCYARRLQRQGTARRRSRLCRHPSVRHRLLGFGVAR